MLKEICYLSIEKFGFSQPAFNRYIGHTALPIRATFAKNPCLSILRKRGLSPIALFVLARS